MSVSLPLRLLRGNCQECICSQGIVSKYQKGISGPNLDRIDIHLDLKCMPIQNLSALDTDNPSTTIRQRVESARQLQEAFREVGQTQHPGQW